VEQKNLFIESTAKTPQIDLNQFTGELILSGKSIPENAALLYERVLKWTVEYVKSPRQTTNFRLNLEYFNTASSIWIARIIKFLSQIDDPEKLLIIHLYFDIEEFDEMEEEDIKEAIAPATDVISDAKLSVGIKIYGKDGNNSILKEKLVLF